MAVGRRTSVYLAPALQAKVDVARAAGFRLSQIVDVGVDAVLGEAVRVEPRPVSRSTRERPPAQAVRERRRLRDASLRVVAPHAGLPVDTNGATPRAVFQPPPFETVPEHPDDGDDSR